MIPTGIRVSLAEVGTDFVLQITGSVSFRVQVPLDLHSVGQIGLEDTLHSSCGGDSAPLLQSQPGFKTGKINFKDVHHIHLPCPVPRSERISKLALQMSKATSWEYYLGTASMHSVSQDPCKPLSLLHHSQIPSN